MNVLLVDDDADLRTLGVLSLGRVAGWKVRAVADGASALAAALEEMPDAILLDVQMPGWDGPETLAALRREPRSAGIPVVFLTAQASSEDIARYRHLGACGVIEKPFPPLALPDLLIAALG